MTESGAQRLQRGAPAGGEGRRRALWRQQQQQEPPSPRPPLPPPPAARSAGCTGGTGPAAARLPGTPTAESLRPWRSGARGPRRARCPFKTPGRWRLVQHPPTSRRSLPGGGGPAAAIAPPLPGCRITGRDGTGRCRLTDGPGSGSRQRAGTGRGGGTLRSPTPSRLSAAAAEAWLLPARPVPPGAPGLGAGGHRVTLAGRCLAAERASGRRTSGDFGFFPRSPGEKWRAQVRPSASRGAIVHLGVGNTGTNRRLWERCGGVGRGVPGLSGTSFVSRCPRPPGTSPGVIYNKVFVRWQGEAAGPDAVGLWLWRAGLCEAALGMVWLNCQVGGYKFTCQRERFRVREVGFGFCVLRGVNYLNWVFLTWLFKRGVTAMFCENPICDFAWWQIQLWWSAGGRQLQPASVYPNLRCAVELMVLKELHE